MDERRQPPRYLAVHESCNFFALEDQPVLCERREE
jgi:hypothetical protein